MRNSTITSVHCDAIKKRTGLRQFTAEFNLKQMAQSMNYLIENNLFEYAELEEKVAQATARFNGLSGQTHIIIFWIAELLLNISK